MKELGAIIYNCSHLALDLEKIFQTYWVLGAPRAVLPRTWPQNFSTHINRFQPLRGRFDGVPTTAYFSVRGAEGACRTPGEPRPTVVPTRASGPRPGEPAPRTGCGPLASGRLESADPAPGEDAGRAVHGRQAPWEGAGCPVIRGGGSKHTGGWGRGASAWDQGGPAQVVLSLCGGKAVGRPGPPSGRVGGWPSSYPMAGLWRPSIRARGGPLDIGALPEQARSLLGGAALF